MVSDLQTFLGFLVFISGVVTEFVEQAKKQIIAGVFKGKELTEQQQSLLEVTLLLIRFFAALGGLLILGGYATLVTYLPFLAKSSEIGALVVSALLVSLGSETLYTLLGFVKSLAAWFNTVVTTTPIGTPQVVNRQ